MAIFNSSKTQTFNPQELNIINSGTSLNGDIKSEGDLRIDGTIHGNVEVKTKLVLGPSSSIDGNITAQHCDISGIVNGNISVSELLSIKASAKISGDISSSKLIIEAGAEFNGKSSMNVASRVSYNGNANGVKNSTENKAPANLDSITEKTTS